MTVVPRSLTYPVAVNPQVQYFLDRFTGARREVVNLWVGRAGRYLTMIRDVLKSRGLPEELAYTAMIESGFNPVAVSRVGAKGMWQFMAGTARRYGLRVDQWIDERLDPEKSTVAAASYLHDLYNQFGSWALAQAAYNAGEVKVSRAIRATGSSDFWALAKTNHLRTETKEFVPAIHAATLIAQDPVRYGFDFNGSAPVAVETVAVPPATDLRRLAPKTGITLDTLRTLNPVLVRAITPPGSAWQLRVPPGTRAEVQSALAPPVKKRPTTSPKITPARSAPRHDVHVVRTNETVSSIAKHYGVSVSDVLRWNQLEAQARIRPGDRLRVADTRTSLSEGQGGFR
jgi:membrane-bound lytic murein transglycosylase D